jgi:hypothetical protein
VAQRKNLIFWGAGATAALGIRTTVLQGKFIRLLADDDQRLMERVAHALGNDVRERWHSPLYDLITILGDINANYIDIDHIDDTQMDAMRRNWSVDQNEEQELRTRIIELRLFFDWPALKSTVRICPANDSDGFKINDLWNVLDMHIPLEFGFRAPAEREGERTSTPSKERFYDARRLIGAKNALLLILTALFHIDYQVCLETKRRRLEQYRDFALEVGRRALRNGLRLTGNGHQLDSPDFYEGDVGFVSLNYDPIGLWIQFIANRELNHSGAVPHIGSPAEPLHLYHNFGHLIPARGIERSDAGRPWYPLNEAAAQRLNEQEYPSGYRVILTKFLFPHGCLCWRECPNCGKLSAYHGHEWKLQASGLFPPPPLRAFDTSPPPNGTPYDERRARERGRVDARACLHCGTLTYAHHTQALMQSSFKSQPPSFIEEIQRELRATITAADHLIFMGYSLPPDDVEYRAIFSACRRHHERQARQERDRGVHCTIVDKAASYPGWYGPAELKKLDFLKLSVVKAARDIFGKENIRFYGGGIPDVFLDAGGRATADKLEQLLDWSSTPT